MGFFLVFRAKMAKFCMHVSTLLIYELLLDHKEDDYHDQFYRREEGRT